MKHHSLESCNDYLPKPKRKFKSVIVQCSWCKKFYVGDYHYGPGWEPVNFIKGEK